MNRSFLTLFFFPLFLHFSIFIFQELIYVSGVASKRNCPSHSAFSIIFFPHGEPLLLLLHKTEALIKEAALDSKRKKKEKGRYCLFWIRASAAFPKFGTRAEVTTG